MEQSFGLNCFFEKQVTWRLKIDSKRVLKAEIFFEGKRLFFSKGAQLDLLKMGQIMFSMR
jgi:hypothetical protein